MSISWILHHLLRLSIFLRFLLSDVLLSLHQDSAEALRRLPQLVLYAVELIVAASSSNSASTGSASGLKEGNGGAIGGNPLKSKFGNSPTTAGVTKIFQPPQAGRVSQDLKFPERRERSQRPSSPLSDSGSSDGRNLSPEVAEQVNAVTPLLPQLRPAVLTRTKRIVDIHRLTPDLAFATFFLSGDPRKYHLPRWPAAMAATSSSTSGLSTGSTNSLSSSGLNQGGFGGSGTGGGSSQGAGGAGTLLLQGGTAPGAGSSGGSAVVSKFRNEPVLDLMDFDDTTTGGERDRSLERYRRGGGAAIGLGNASGSVGPTPGLGGGSAMQGPNGNGAGSSSGAPGLPALTAFPTSKAKLHQKVLALDLDGTLIYACLAHHPSRFASPPTYAEVIPSVDGAQLYWVWERPNLQRFLSIASRWYNLVIYTASVASYADPIIDRIERHGRRRRIKRRYYREDCTYIGNPSASAVTGPQNGLQGNAVQLSSISRKSSVASLSSVSSTQERQTIMCPPPHPTTRTSMKPVPTATLSYRKDLTILGVPLEGVVLIDDTPGVLGEGAQQVQQYVIQPYLPPLRPSSPSAPDCAKTGKPPATPERVVRHRHVDDDDALLTLLPLLEALYYAQELPSILSLKRMLGKGVDRF
jgi:hypothetical protein